MTSLNCQNWPPNSSDLILVDYSVWDALQQLHGVSSEVQKYRPSETSPEQLLSGEPRTNQPRDSKTHGRKVTVH